MHHDVAATDSITPPLRSMRAGGAAAKAFALACAWSIGCAGEAGSSQATSAAGSTGDVLASQAAAAGISGTTGAGAVAGSQPAAAGAAGTGKLSFANDIFPKVVRSKCGACHNDAPSFGGLAFFPGGPEVAYMNLVNTPAGNEPNYKCKDSGLERVQPGDPEHSLMYLKLTNPPCGSKMPSAPYGMATPEQVELVRQWIVDGAEP
jgi:hypothetical protein